MITEQEFIKTLETTPQKYEDFGTISYQMKLDIFNNFKDKNLKCLEIGCYKGYTTNIFSNIFDEVIGLDNNNDSLECAKDNNKNNKNVSFIKLDLYNPQEWKKIESIYKNQFQVALIDANHSYNSFKTDFTNVINLGCKYIILDDVGVYDSIKKAVEEIKIEYSSQIKSTKTIGIDWKHYKLPLLNVPVFLLRIQEKNIGFSSFRFIWTLRDITDININEGNKFRPMYEPMNVDLQIIRNHADVLSGHEFYRMLRNGSKEIIHFTSTSSEIFPKHTFVPFPTHRFSTDEINSFTSNKEIFNQNDTNFEGLIIEL
jgi:hypothetical protein